MCARHQRGEPLLPPSTWAARHSACSPPPPPDPAERLWPAAGRLGLDPWRRRRAALCHWYCRRGRHAPRVERSWSRPHPRRRGPPRPPHVRAARAARAARVVATSNNRTCGCSPPRVVGWRFFCPLLSRATMGQVRTPAGGRAPIFLVLACIMLFLSLFASGCMLVERVCVG